ncbi:motile sperm domain-containing protein 2 [Tetranychus urticae]|uniref:MSP domain-containing protein n=1 Tax=Tetranychus urticae TaxID=32264 RepID=T1KXQ8_TETUR|nr:motile sperm domain-containing protein 2 [Tetranychus urticae]
MSRTDRSAENVKRLREAFRQEYLTNPDLYYDQDYQKLETDDWYVKRFFLARNRNETAALQMIIEAMKWRKHYKIREFRDQHFSMEFYKIGTLFIYECDLDGYLTVYIRVKMHLKVPELNDHCQKFLIHVLNKADILTRGNGIGIVFDVTGASYGNLDLDYMKFLINIGANYFPVGVKYILVVNVPWTFNAFRRAALSFLPSSWFGLIKFANGKEIFNFIDKSSVPDYLGGTCKRSYRAIPPGCRSMSQVLTELGYTQEDIDNISSKFSNVLEEASKSLEIEDYVNPNPDFWDSCDDENETKDGSITDLESTDSNNKCLIINTSTSIRFRYDYRDRAYGATLMMSNPLESPVAFRIKSTNPSKYTVSPSFGIISPKKTMTVTIKFNQDSGSAIVNDKFLILGLPINRPRLTAEDFYKIWIQQKSKIYSIKLLPILESEQAYDGINDEDDDFVDNKIRQRFAQNKKTLINGNLKSGNNNQFDQHINPLTEKVDTLVNQQKKTWLFLVVIIFLYFIFLFCVLFLSDSVHFLRFFRSVSYSMLMANSTDKSFESFI